jgi:hypothetical protein
LAEVEATVRELRSYEDKVFPGAVKEHCHPRRSHSVISFALR